MCLFQLKPSRQPNMDDIVKKIHQKDREAGKQLLLAVKSRLIKKQDEEEGGTENGTKSGIFSTQKTRLQ